MYLVCGSLVLPCLGLAFLVGLRLIFGSFARCCLFLLFLSVFDVFFLIFVTTTTKSTNKLKQRYALALGISKNKADRCIGRDLKADTL